jgi:uncharacterized membrane protein YjjP (DUF1212 family)
MNTEPEPCTPARAPEPLEPELSALLSLGEALHTAGTPTRRLEEALVEVAGRLGLTIQVFATVTCLIVSFGARSLRTVLVRLEPSELDLGRLVRLDAIVHACARGQRSPKELIELLARVSAERPGVSPLAMTAMRAAGAAAWALLLGGGARAALASGLAGIAVSALAVTLRGRRGMPSAELPALGGFVAGLTVSLANRLWGPLPLQLATMTALLPLLPGLPLVIGVEEIASRDLLAGSSRLMAAVLVFLQLAFGVALGTRILTPMPGAALHEPAAWEQALLLLCAVRVLAVQLGVERADLPWVIAAGLLGYGCTRLAGALFGSELGAFLGALLIGVLANAVARWWDRPALLIAVPGLFSVWPGALGFLCVNALWSRHDGSGVHQLVTMMMTTVAAVIGLLVSERLLSPGRTL